MIFALLASGYPLRLSCAGWVCRGRQAPVTRCSRSAICLICSPRGCFPLHTS